MHALKNSEWNTHFSIVLPLALSLFCNFINAIGYECHSCLKSCETTADGRLDPEVCDCEADELPQVNRSEPSKCTGQYCFAKIEYFPDESIVIIQKGCVEGLVKGLKECHYAGQPESVHCYCEGEFCNNKIHMHSYLPKSLPTLECCECSQPSGDTCPKDSCLRTCRGNYCLVDFDGVEQGCGLGIPRLQSFLRIPNYLEDLQGETTCAKYQATFSTSVHGCVCTKPTGMCNALEEMTHYQVENVIKRRIDNMNYCYSIHQRNYENPLEEGVFNKSETCEGHYCFIVLTTSELVVEVRNKPSNNGSNAKPIYTGKSATRYEILAGCLQVDDDKKVSIGCTTEYTSEGNVLSKHCICDSHLCNYYSVIADSVRHGNSAKLIEEANRNPTSILHDSGDSQPTAAFIQPRHSSAQSPRHGISLVAMLIFRLILMRI